MSKTSKYIDMRINGDELIRIDGNILNYVIDKSGKIYGGGGKEVRPYENPETGLLMVTLNNGSEIYKVEVRMLVAQAYVPNPNSLTFIKHLDGIKSNFHASNLEWCDNDDISINNNMEMGTDPDYDLGVCVSYRLFQGKSNAQVAKEFGIDVPKVREVKKELEGKFLIEYHQAETYKTRLRILRPFVISLIKRGLSYHSIAQEIDMPDVDMSTLERHARYVKADVLRLK